MNVLDHVHYSLLITRFLSQPYTGLQHQPAEPVTINIGLKLFLTPGIQRERPFPRRAKINQSTNQHFPARNSHV